MKRKGVDRLLQNRLLAAVLLAAAVCCGVLGLYALMRLNLVQAATALIHQNTPTPVFLLLMLVLPLAGVPLTVFIFVLGVKFGIGWGILLLELIMPAHILASYMIARGVRGPLTRLLVRRGGYHIPEIPEDKVALFSFLFLAVPVLPYAAKNYVLPLAGVPFRYCMWLNWAIQGSLSIPFVILGKSAADTNLLVFGATLAVLAVLFFALRRLQQWYESLSD
jgi:uncharacterized membrane protein YdjX (TVP38/TMEM64 family)